MEDPKTEELKLPIFGGFCFWLKNFENIELGAVFQWGVGNIFRFRSFNIFGFKLKSTITVEIKIVKIGTYYSLYSFIYGAGAAQKELF